MDDLINVGDGTPGPDFAALAPAIYELAEAGDAVAAGCLRQAAADLVDFVLLVRAKLCRKHGIAGEVPVAWTGGVIEKMPIVREAFFAGLKAAAPNMPVAQETLSPWKAPCGGRTPGGSRQRRPHLEHLCFCNALQRPIHSAFSAGWVGNRKPQPAKLERQ